MCLSEYLTSIADALRRKKGTNDKINAQDFVKEIDDLSGIKGVSLDDGENIVVEVEDQTIILKGDINTYKIEANDSWVDVSEATGPIEITADAHPSVIINSDSGSIKLNLIDATVDLSDCSSEVAIVDKFNKTHTVYYNDVEVGPDMEGGSTVNLDVPQVTDITLSEEGVLSWTVPSVDVPDEYDAIVSYILNLNGDSLEVSGNNADVFDYLVDGDNEISVTVKVRLHKYSDAEEVTIHYSLPSYLIETTAVKTRIPMCSMASATSGKHIYTFGGESTGGPNNFIHVFNIETEQLENINVNTSETISGAAAVTVGDYIYYIGGYTSDTSATGTMRRYYVPNNTMDGNYSHVIQSDNGITNVCAVAVGTYIYIFGGSNNRETFSRILKYDTVAKTHEELSATLPAKISSASAALVGTDVYIFGGYGSLKNVDTILKFDTVNETIETLSVTLPIARQAIGISVVGNNVYLFGGIPFTDEILKFDVARQTVEVLDIKLPSPRGRVTAQSVGKNIYIFGGKNADGLTDEILKFTAN